jgi:nucleotide-binding universal stress UspA family protein
MSPTSDIKHILVPHDFGDTAEHALAFALKLAEKFGARVTILHVTDVPSYAFPEGPAMTVQMMGEIERAARIALDAAVARARRPGVVVDGQIRQGPAWREIEAFARETKTDLIAIGTHGRRGLARALLGSVAEKVVRTAPCAVLTVHAPESPHA